MSGLNTSHKLFWVSSLLNLVGNFMGLDPLAMVAKPFLMISLAHYFWYETEHRRKLANIFSVALLCSWMGDIFLIWGHIKVCFLVGLISFAIAHILYGFTFLKVAVTRSRQFKPLVLVGGVLVLVFAFTYGRFLWEHTGAMKIPVLVYLVIIVSMALSALFRYGATGTSSYFLTVFGCVLFMASDSILAYAKFVKSFYFDGFAIMLTYILGQWFLTRGMIAHGKES